MSKQRARKIKLIIFDVDGVLTDGSIWLFPAPMNVKGRKIEPQPDDTGGFSVSGGSMMEAKGFHAHDGTGFTLARMGGLKTGLITKRASETVALRARDLKLEYVYQGVANKLTCFRDILKQEGITADQAAFVGDDIIDLPVMRNCGLAIAVKNARPEVKKEAHHTIKTAGGHGAVREVVEYVLKAQGTFKQVVDDYVKALTPPDIVPIRRPGKKQSARPKR